MSAPLQPFPPSHPSGELSDLSRRALAFYEERLKDALEQQHPGQGVAVHPDSGDYLVAGTPTQAGRDMDRRHPEGGTVTLRIGPGPDYALAGRMLAGQMAATRK